MQYQGSRTTILVAQAPKNLSKDKHFHWMLQCAWQVWSNIVLSQISLSGEYTMFKNYKITTLPNHHILKPALQLVVLMLTLTFYQ